MIKIWKMTSTCYMLLLFCMEKKKKKIAKHMLKQKKKQSILIWVYFFSFFFVFALFFINTINYFLIPCHRQFRLVDRIGSVGWGLVWGCKICSDIWIFFGKRKFCVIISCFGKMQTNAFNSLCCIWQILQEQNFPIIQQNYSHVQLNSSGYCL